MTPLASQLADSTAATKLPASFHLADLRRFCQARAAAAAAAALNRANTGKRNLTCRAGGVGEPRATLLQARF